MAVFWCDECNEHIKAKRFVDHLRRSARHRDLRVGGSGDRDSSNAETASRENDASWYVREEDDNDNDSTAGDDMDGGFGMGGEMEEVVDSGSNIVTDVVFPGAGELAWDT
jgi:hypothetical protein